MSRAVKASFQSRADRDAEVISFAIDGLGLPSASQLRLVLC